MIFNCSFVYNRYIQTVDVIIIDIKPFDEKIVDVIVGDAILVPSSNG